MKIFEPWNLLLLTLLVPVIVFFYLLKLKRRDVVVSSVLLWSHLTKDVQANAPFQKLRKNLLLFLQLAIATLCVFALARPAFFTQALGGSNVIVILDGSASMESHDARGTRFDEAKATALRMVGDMHGGDRMMVLLATSRTHRLTSLTTDRNELRSAITTATPRETTTNLRDAILLAVSAAGQQQQSRIFVISDGAFPPLDDVDTRGSEVQFVKVGSRADNVGSVAMDVRRSFKQQSGYQMFVAVRNYGAQPKKCNLELYRGDALIDVRPLDLPAADPVNHFSEKAEVINDLPDATGILRARLDSKDDLPADDEAYSQLMPQRDTNVLLVTEGDVYLQKALLLDPHIHLSQVSPGAYRGEDNFDVVIFENVAPKKVGPGNHLYINCGGPTAPVDINSKITNATILDWDRVHPVMRFVKFSQLQLPEALTATKKPWAVGLAEHEGGVAIAVGEKAGVKSGYVGFPLLRTDFPLRVAFPIFFNNMVQWLAAKPGRTEGIQLRTGGTAPIDIPARLTQVTVTDPDGNKYPVRSEGRLGYFSETERRGIYQVDGKNFHQEFAVNLLSRDESATAPQQRIQFGRRPILAGTGTTRTAREVWWWLLFAALVVLGIEWWVYHRRI